MIQTIQQITEILQLLFDLRWSMPLLHGSCSFSCAAMETFLALPQLQLVEKSPLVVFRLHKTAGFSAVAVHHGLCLPVVMPRLIPMVLATIETPPVLLRQGGQCPYYAGRADFHLCAFVVLCGHGMCMAGLLVTLHPAVCSLRRRQQWQYTAGFTGDEAPCAVFNFPFVRPKMRDIMAGFDEKDSQAVHPCRGAEADSHGLDCSADHSCSPVAVHVVVDVPVSAVVL